MQIARMRTEEAAAIAALHKLEVLDTEPEAEFDALVRAAAALCGVPISVVSLIDSERQWFKAAIGLPGVQETPRNVAFCAHAVLGDELFEVADARQDARFADNPLVTGQPDIRFYAGAPVRLPHGERIGTLCVIDRKPRQLDATQREVLMCLAEATSRALQSRHALRQTAQAAERAAQAELVLQHSADAIVGATTDGVVVSWNPAAERLFGYAAGEIIGQTLQLLAPAHQQPEDHDAFARIRDGQPLTYERVLMRQDGAPLNVSITAVPTFDTSGSLFAVTHFIRDITLQVQIARQLAQSEERTWRLYESTPAMLHSIDPQGRVLAVSDFWLAKLGHRREQVIGRLATDFLTPKSRQISRQQVLPRLFATGRVDGVEYQVLTRAGEVLDVLLCARVEYDDTGLPVRTLTVMEDVTLRRQAERALRDEKERLANILEGTEAGTWAYSPATGAVEIDDNYRGLLGLADSDPSPSCGDELFEHVHPLDRQAVRDTLAAHVAGRTAAFEAEFRIHRDDGRMRWVLARAKTVSRDACGRAVKVVGIQMDISRRVALGEAAQASRHDLQNILDALPSCVGYWDTRLVNRFANVAYHRWFGAAPSTIPGMHLRDLLGDERFELNQPAMQAALRGEPQSFERSMPVIGGPGVRDMMVHYLPDKAGSEVRGFYVLVHDVSELKLTRQRAQAAARKSQALLETIQRHAIFSVTDRAGRIIDANPAFCQISGYSLDELVGQTHRIVKSSEQCRTFWPDVWRTIAAGVSWRGEVCNRKKDGSLYWVDSIITPFVDESGSIENFISVRFDITQAKLAERSLRASEAFLDRTGRMAGVGGWEFDVGSQQVRWSPEVYRIHELDPSVSPPLADALNFFPAAARDELEKAFTAAATHGTRYDLELPFVSATGRRKWVRTVGEAELVDGQVVRLFGALQDISERKEAADAVRSTNQRFALASDSAGIGVWEYDLQSDSLVWDDWMYRLYGRERTADVSAYSLWSENLHPGDRQRSEQDLLQAIEGSQPFDTEFRVIWPDGSVRHLKATAQVQRDASGKALRMTGVNFDITERRRAEDAINRTSVLLHTAMDAATEVAIIAVDLTGTISVFNTGAERLLGFDRAEVVGIKSSMDFHDRDELRRCARTLSAELGRTVRTGLSLVDPAALGRPHEWTYRHKNGSALRVSLTVTAMRDTSGHCFGYLGVAHDISRQRDYERSLQGAAEAAQRANRAKSEFLANMSHEIRTPLNALIGVGHLLSDSLLDDDQRQLLAKSQLAGRSLLGIVNDVLDLAKIESGEVSLEEAMFAPAQLLQDIEAMFQPQAASKGVSLELSSASEVPPWLVGDATRLRQIVTNLVGNALKFTATGGVQMRLTLLDAGASLVRLRCTVRDTGVGIDADTQARLFKPFAQADVSTTRRFGGSGLGLSIVRQLAQLMGGETGVSSQPGVGSEFWAVITLALPSAGQAAPSTHDAATLEVAVVDHQAADRLALVAHSRALGWRATELESGTALVSLVEDRLAAGKPLPDAVLIEQQMPGMTGLQSIEHLSGLLGRERLPAVLVCPPGDRARIAALDSGRLAASLLTKPIGASELFNAVNDGVARYTGSTARVLQSTSVGALPARWLTGVRVLVVDDNEINRDVACRLLEREGAEVKRCNNGRDAVARLCEQPDAFDVVLMDVQMPEMDGLEATRRVRQFGVTVPVVAQTAGALVEERRRALAAGMTDFMSKPLDPHVLVRTLRRVVEAHRGTGLLVQPLAGDAHADLSGWPEVRGIDRADAALRTGGDATLFLSSLERLSREFGDLASPDLTPSVDGPGRAALAARVHKLRGGLGMLGALHVHRLAGEAETALHQVPGEAHRPLSELASGLRDLFDAAAQVIAKVAANLSAKLSAMGQATSPPAHGTVSPAAAGNGPTLEELETLMGLLRRQEMEAVDQLDALAPRLLPTLGSSRLAELKSALDELDFAAALGLLRPLVSSQEIDGPLPSFLAPLGGPGTKRQVSDLAAPGGPTRMAPTDDHRDGLRISAS